MIFKRKIYDEMLQWKSESAGESALLIEGPRRVGKSTIVKEFAKNEYRSFVIIDFARATDEEKSIFNNVSDLELFFTRLKLVKGVSLYPRESVIIFDEIQQYPLARQAVKYLVEDGRYDYIETGSLISIRQNVADILIPSEEESVNMHPMDYEEFKWAMGDYETIPMLRKLLAEKKSIGDDVNRKLMQDYRLYMLVGGMPQAVSKYIETHDLCAVDKLKRSILKLYVQDLQKLDKAGNAQLMFKSIPGELHKNTTRYQVSRIVKNARTESIVNYVDMLNESRTVNVAFHADDPSVGMSLSTNRFAYKMYLCDTGLFVTLAFWNKKFVENDIYRKLLSDKLDVNLGYVYENAVAQAVASSGHKLFYYTWPAPNNHVYEIDFLLSKGSKICPVEVKSSGYNTHASLDVFCEKFSNRVSERYVIYTKDLKKDGSLLLIPIYMCGLL